MSGRGGAPPAAAEADLSPERVWRALRAVVYRDTSREITAAEVLDALAAAGVRWYVTGGTVRDWVRGREPRDLDFLVDRDVPVVRGALRTAFPGIDPSRRPRPDGFVLQWGEGGETGLDLAMIRSYRDVRGTLLSTRFRPGDDLLENALVTDFSFNTLCWDPRTEAVLDPLGNGVADAKEDVLRLAVHPRVLPAMPHTTLRIVLFLCRGYEPADNTLDHLERRAEEDLAAMERRLPRWISTHLLPSSVEVADFRRRLRGWLRSDESLRRFDRGLQRARARSRAAS